MKSGRVLVGESEKAVAVGEIGITLELGGRRSVEFMLLAGSSYLSRAPSHILSEDRTFPRSCSTELPLIRGTNI